MSDEELEEYEARYCQRQQRELNAFFQLRLLLAPLVETTILLDRLVYLDQQVNSKKMFLFPLLFYLCASFLGVD